METGPLDMGQLAMKFSLGPERFSRKPQTKRKPRGGRSEGIEITWCIKSRDVKSSEVGTFRLLVRELKAMGHLKVPRTT